MTAIAEPHAKPAEVRDDDPPRVRLTALGPGHVASWTAPSPAHPDSNEDALAVIPFGAGSGILAVADGVGGERRGAEASRIAVRALAEAVGSPDGADASLRTRIVDGFELANQRVLALGGGATTLAVLEVDGDHVRPYHVGDSLILGVGQRGRVKHRTLAHGPVGYGIEAGLIDAADALHHDDLHVVSNVVGSSDMRIEIGPRRRLAPRDTVLLASDGLSDNLYLDEIVERIRKGPTEAAANRLVELAAERMAAPLEGRPHKPDDLTFVLFRLGPPPR